ncbi:GNAT family N-acetyltransferase [Flavobacterium sp. J372]|uniref:GNAT family N-acetyltransferase n=1 Tax=Flavobacterium sp. J372 TaxID=2898436 RepID=UPI002150A237|nr:GNAT family N-acetyltransferase [Flavobacterium sp. J372]MCR5860762.1 GNAT family N-acetyltransferase [Flavobacterium sp. J372]
MSDVVLRRYRAEDLYALIELFRGTVHAINAKDYTQAQLDAWAPVDIDAERWGPKLLQHYTIVAEMDGVLCGFADIDGTGYFDHLFVHKDYQGRGIAKELVKAVEAFATQSEVKTITVNVSITARPFFLKQGYELVKQQEVEYNGQRFTNYAMKKQVTVIK